MSLTESQEKSLEKAKNYFKAASNNLLYQKWRSAAIEDFAFYDGEKQFPEKVIKKLRERGQEAITVNKIKAMVKQCCGTEINTRMLVAFRSHSFDEEEQLLARALTHVGFAVQKDQNFAFYGSLKFRDGLVSGLGWSQVFNLNGKIHYDYVHPLNLIYDANDFSPQLTKMRYVVCMRWISKEELKQLFPKKSKQIDSIFQNKDDVPSFFGNNSEESLNRTSSATPSSLQPGINGDKLLVVEVQYKRPKVFFSGVDISGRDFSQKEYSFETFDEEEAVTLAGSEEDVTESMGTQIVRTVFCGDVLLSHAPLSPNIPNMREFSYVPYVFDRRSSDAVPTSWISDLKDLQRELNYRKLKELNALGSVRAIITENAFPGMTKEEIRDEVNRPDGLIVRGSHSEKDSIVIQQNTDIAQSQVKASERIDYELQQVSGQFNDSLGDQSNATSGLAIKQRQLASGRNMAGAFDAAALVKEREGRLLLDLLQGSLPEDSFVNILDDDEKASVFLNVVREHKGKKVIINNVRNIPVSVYIEKVRDYDSSPEEQQASLEALLSNPNAPMILQNTDLLKLLGFRHADRISKSMQMAQQNNMLAPKGGNDNSLTQEEPLTQGI